MYIVHFQVPLTFAANQTIKLRHDGHALSFQHIGVLHLPPLHCFSSAVWSRAICPHNFHPQISVLNFSFPHFPPPLLTFQAFRSVIFGRPYTFRIIPLFLTRSTVDFAICIAALHDECAVHKINAKLTLHCKHENRDDDIVWIVVDKGDVTMTSRRATWTVSPRQSWWSLAADTCPLNATINSH